VDQGFATSLAAIATLIVGTGVVIVTLISSNRAVRSTLQAQLSLERNRGLIALIEIAQASSTNVNDTIFNVSEARDGGDDRTGDMTRLYGPRRRVVLPIPATDRARARALLSVHGVWEIRLSYLAWEQSLAALELLLEEAEFNYFENAVPATPDFFAFAQIKESAALARLGATVANELAVVPRIQMLAGRKRQKPDAR
jgi:hypothetical protein